MPAPQIRQKLSLDPGWLFHLGDIESPLPDTHIAAYMANKAGWARGAAKPGFDDSDWRVVDLPHDWSVEGKLDRANHLSNGYLPRGVGWYRRYFRLDDADRGKYLALTFDGVASHCTVFVNGHIVHRNFCGYTPFTIDISDIATFGDQLNVIAVRVDATVVEGWWYEGAGIYRHVWLTKTSPIHFATDRVFVDPIKQDDSNWVTRIEATIENSSDVARTCELYSEFAGVNGDFLTEVVELPARSSATVHHSFPTQNPALWSCETPVLQCVRVVIRSGETLLDDLAVNFGYRTIRFDPAEGFFLNDEPLRLLGTCNHQDHAGVGVAVPDSIHEFRIRRLKDMGCNAYRCAHNPPAAELLDACDRLGMLVMDENRTFGSSPEHLAQLTAMVKRDRNHPSVIMWSLCNEEAIQGTPAAANIARTMTAVVKKLDPSRPVTAAVSGGLLNDDCIADAMELVGINYQLAIYDPFHAKHANIPIYAAETHCAYSTRGEYETNPERRVFGSYDSDRAPWGATARETWRAISARPFVAGLFAWTGFDYRGEPTPHEWPSISTHWGILDTCGFEKEAFCLHKAWFTKEPFVHLLPHWNWPPGSDVRVMAYTNCSEVELRLNGELLARQAVDPIEMAQWQVVYRAGELTAVGYRNGIAVATASVVTAGPAVALGLEVHPSFDCAVIPADGMFAVPVTVFATDAQTRRVPTAGDHVTFSVSGPGRIIGVGNGDPNCHEPDKAAERTLFNGLAQVIVQTTNDDGEIVLEARADGRIGAVLRLVSSPGIGRAVLPPVTRRHFVSDWRMSPITIQRPDVNQAIADQDMNSWERVDPANGPQPAWVHGGGFAIYRATFSPPKSMQMRGGQMRLHEIVGAAEVFVNGVKRAMKSDAATGSITIDLPAAERAVTISVLLSASRSPAGICQAVELLALP